MIFNYNTEQDNKKEINEILNWRTYKIIEGFKIFIHSNSEKYKIDWRYLR